MMSEFWTKNKENCKMEMNRMTTSEMEVCFSGGRGRGLCTGSIMTFGGLFYYNIEYHRIPGSVTTHSIKIM